jgi:hypothetical protein
MPAARRRPRSGAALPAAEHGERMTIGEQMFWPADSR